MNAAGINALGVFIRHGFIIPIDEIQWLSWANHVLSDDYSSGSWPYCCYNCVRKDPQAVEGARWI
jgi:hypothetical protein